jgi:hypothetical protein
VNGSALQLQSYAAAFPNTACDERQLTGDDFYCCELRPLAEGPILVSNPVIAD